MKVINKTTGHILTHNLKIATSVKDRALGLIILDKKQSILLHTRFGIHTIGMKFPIDVVILDNRLRVRKLKIAMQPNSIFLWNPLFSKVIELPHGALLNSKTSMGDLLEVQQ